MTENVATPEQIDSIVKQIGGFSSGPFEAIDQMGLDTALNISESLFSRSYEARQRPSPLLKQMVDSGLLGKKSGKGFYEYTDAIEKK